MAQIKIVQGDITQQQTAAIVNAANTSLRGGGGVDGAIHRAAGPQLDAACQKLGGCPTGQAKTTAGFNLPAKYIIHTPGPIWHGGSQDEARLLASCYKNSLAEAQKHGCTGLAFPSISTGIYGYPLEKAAAIAIRTVTKAQLDIDVTFVCFDELTFRAYQQALAEL